MSLLEVNVNTTLQSALSSLTSFTSNGASNGALGGASAEGGVTVDLDFTLFVQLGFFLVLLLVLKPTLFDPMLKLFEEREKRIEGKRAEAGKIDAKSAKSAAKYDAAMGVARGEAAVDRDALRAEGLKREGALMVQVPRRGRRHDGARSRRDRAGVEGGARAIAGRSARARS